MDRHIFRCALAALLLALGSAHLCAQPRNLVAGRVDARASDKRVALVIGNSDYKASPLRNPVNDAKDMSAKLRDLGFEVIERTNLGARQIGATLREFRSKLAPGAVALVFYAGHGLQVRGENYLPAVDSEIGGEEDLPNQSLAVRQIMDILDDVKTRLNLVFLDACRNNPYARSFRSTNTGLARVAAPAGTLISFATRPGSVAADGSGRNGLYTSALLEQMNSPNQPIEQMLKRVVTEVKVASNGRQEPWMEGSIEGEFCFGECAGSAAAAPRADYDTAAYELAFWDSIKASSNPEDFKAYLEQYPQGRFASLARNRLAAGAAPASLAAASVGAEKARAPGAATPTVPAAPAAGTYSLDDLKKQQEARTLWGNWQKQMQAAFDQTAAMALMPDLQAAAWGRFLERYTEDNPYGGDAVKLRAEAHKRKRAAEAESVMQAQAAALAATTTGEADAPAQSPTRTETAAAQSQSPLTQNIGASPARPAPESTMRDCPHCPALIPVQPGQFLMGSAESDGRDSELPAHTVRVAYSFLIGKYAVTVREFRAFVQATGYNPTGCNRWTGTMSILFAGKTTLEPHWSWQAPGYAQEDSSPVACVSFVDASRYAEWLTKTTGRSYRLPSEAEWEFAARAGTTTSRPWGDEIQSNRANCHDCGSAWDNKSAAPVGSFPPNALGLHDMLGNVWQWTGDCWHADYHDAPAGGGARESGDCALRTVRGGSWYDFARFVRTAIRDYAGINTRLNTHGFRVVASPSLGADSTNARTR